MVPSVKVPRHKALGFNGWCPRRHLVNMKCRIQYENANDYKSLFFYKTAVFFCATRLDFFPFPNVSIYCIYLE